MIKNIPDIAVGISLSNLDDTDNKIIEPHASTASERIQTLQELHSKGIRTYLFVAPYLPGLTSLRSLYDSVKGYVDYICVENLNLRGSYKQTMLEVIHEYHPELYSLWRDIYVNKHSSEYWSKLEEEITKLRETVDIPVISYLYHEKIKKK